MDAMQSRFDDNLNAINSELSEFRSHIQDHVTDPIMTRLNNMQQSFQDNMGALSSQFDNLSTNESIQDIRGSSSSNRTLDSSPLSLTPSTLTIIACRTGRSGLPEISGRAFRVFYISGFQQLNPYSYPNFRVPVISGTRKFGFGFG
jgi:hypothetical protein